MVCDLFEMIRMSHVSAVYCRNRKSLFMCTCSVMRVLSLSLAVITELDGLAKGQDNFGGGSGGRSTGSRGNYNVSATHVRAVQEKARMAVAFLERGFEAREPCLRALTSRGNQLESISFRSEDTSGQQVRCFFIISFLFFCW